MDENCPHCVRTSFAFAYRLYDTKQFHIVCDVHPIKEGHLLIIPNEHLSCIGVYPDEALDEFRGIYKDCKKFISDEYGTVASFEHGVFGQTVYHSHVHLIPTEAKLGDILPEGESYASGVSGLTELRQRFEEEGGYLFVAFDEQLLCVDSSLVAPRFFRDRFAKAVGNSERGNWKSMRENAALMETSRNENLRCTEKFNGWKSRRQSA